MRATAIRVIEETGLLPHLNPGVMSWEDMARLKHVSASMGMMLETSSERLSEKGGPHFGSPDKVPAVRLRTIEDAGRLAIPFTTGILVGIGETLRERAESLLAIRSLHLKYRHVQEVIVQNFRAEARHGDARARPSRPRTSSSPRSPSARVLFGSAHEPAGAAEPVRPELPAADRRRHQRLGRRVAGHHRPREPGGAVAEARRPRAANRRARATRCASGWPIYPEYALRPDPWLAGKMQEPVRRLAGDDGLAVEGRAPEPVAWQDPEVAWKPRTIALTFAKGAGRRPARRRRRRVRRGGLPRGHAGLGGEAPRRRPSGWTPRSGRRSAWPRTAAPTTSSDEAALALFQAEGAALEALCAVADDLRREAVGDEVTYVVNRNINFTNVCYTGCRFCAFAQREIDPESYTLSLDEVADRAQEAWDYGATEVCIQGGLHPSLPGDFYFRHPRDHSGPRAGHAHPRVQPDGGRERLDAARHLVPRVPPGVPRARPRLHPRHRRGDPRRRRPVGADARQAPRRHVGGGRHDGARPRHPLVVDDHVRPRRRAAALGRAHPAARPDPGPDGRVHRVRAAAVRAPELADLLGGQGTSGPHPRRQPAHARGRPGPAARADPERPGAAG